MCFHWKHSKTFPHPKIRMKTATYFEKECIENITADFIKYFLAKITVIVAITFICDKCMPTMTENSLERMKNLPVLLPQQQMEILHSQDKHIIIDGDFGCGKTTMAAAILKKILESLKNDEKLYCICYDSKSELLSHITKNTQKKNDVNVMPYHNKE